VELTLAVAASSVLVAGLGSTVLISTRTLSRDATPGADANRAAEALARLAADVRQAMQFTERTATAITVIVPDRDGDAVHEKIRYSWSGTPGHSLMYQYNSETALAIAEDVKQFDLSPIIRSIVADPVLPPPTPVMFEVFTEAKASTDVTSLDVLTPTGANQGKLLIALVAVDGAGGGAPMTAPAGWNLISRINNGGQVGLGVWWKLAGAAEPTSNVFTWTIAEQAYGCIMRFSGANTLSPINAFSTAQGTSSTPQCPSITTTEGYTMILRLGAFDSDNININNAGMSQHTTISVDRSNTGGGSVSGGAAYDNLDPPGSSGAANFTLTGAQEFVTFTVAIAPQPSS
jgi:hypothetical protein